MLGILTLNYTQLICTHFEVFIVTYIYTIKIILNYIKMATFHLSLFTQKYVCAIQKLRILFHVLALFN